MIRKTHLVVSLILGLALSLGFSLMLALSTTAQNPYLIPTVWALVSYLFYTRFSHTLIMLISSAIILGVFGILMLPLFLIATKMGWVSKDIGFGIIAFMFFPLYGLVIGFILLLVGLPAYFWIRKRKKRKTRFIWE